MTDREILELILSGQRSMAENFASMETRMESMENRMDSMDSRLSRVEDDVKGIRLRLENTTDKNIQIIAENYSNLLQKLDKNNLITDQQFAYQIKVNYLMDDVQRIKDEIKEMKVAMAL
ncbi:MAG: hypothetical protein Q4C77_19040 [Eubacteriales bacterium]|nr:hypothetical protein [Eubacteriales bacterium]